MFKGLGNLADMAGMMKRVMEMKQKMEEVKESLGSERVEGVAGGGMVKVLMTGKMEVLNVTFEPGVINPAEPELLATLTRAAINDAMKKAHDLVKDRMKDLTGGLDIPGL